MTLKQKQALLAYLGYYDGQLDGVWGQQSWQATIDFQRDYMEPPDVDGIFEAVTEKRILEVIYNREEPTAQAAPVDKIPEKSVAVDKDNMTTGTFWDEIEFFDREEFRCQCKGKYCDGFPEEPEEELVRVCNEIRRRMGVPVEIVTAGGSGVRCPVHNAAVGGVANSNHLYGKAADLHSKKSPQEMAQVAKEVMGNTGEIGIYDWGIHVGVNCKYSRFYG